MISAVPRPAIVFLIPLLCLGQNTPEVSSTPAVAVFQSSTSLVQVPVVVRDSKDNAVGNLRAEDFQLFDNGKPQTISKFAIEKFESSAALKQAAAPAPASAQDIKIAGLPDRFIAYVFDDIHMSLPDLKYTRDATKKQLEALDLSHQRAGIFTTSGRYQREFTGDRDALLATLGAITVGREDSEKALDQMMCPHIDYYMGDLITNQHDPTAKRLAMAEAMGLCKYPPDSAERVVDTTARQAVANGDNFTRATLADIRAVVNRMAALPGQRTLVLISPGFLVVQDRHDELMALIDRAQKSNVIIGALDARGLFTTSADASGAITPSPERARLLATEALTLADSIATIADGTGGVFEHGTNDYDGGIARVAAPPEYLYMLGFSPTALKPDGKIHSLKVTLVNGRGYTVRARNSYYADNHPEDPASQIRQQIQDAFFSNQELHGLPVRLQAEFFKDGDKATLTANVRVDATKLAFRKEEGRNRDDLTMVIGVFDQNGNFVSAFQKTIEMRLREETLNAWMKSGIENSTDFEVQPGKYLVRLVVRDSQGESMAEQSTGVDIPW